MSLALSLNQRTHCDCGNPLAPLSEGKGNWGDWKCRKCGWAYCQDCGSALDESDQCLALESQKDE